MARKFLISRIALAVALSSGLAGFAASPALAAKKEKAPAASYSDGFRKAAGPIQEAMNAATSSLPSPAKPEDYAAAKAKIDAALGGDGKAAFEAAAASATTPDDKLAMGSMLRNYGLLSQDLATKQQGNVMLLESGKLEAAQAGPSNYDAGITAYQLKDYANAAKYLKAAKDLGFQDPNNQLDLILADSYKRNNNPEAALAMSKQEIEDAKARGVAPSENALRAALQSTYTAKQLAPSADYAALLAQYYPETWNVAISVVRQLAALPNQENLDLMRLMFVTNAMTEKRDYAEYLDNVDPRAYPGEALKVMNDGLAKGKLTNADLGDEKANTSARVAGDKASLPSVEKDAMKPGATVAAVTSAADVFLSYDQYAKAETLYAKAMGMPGVDANKVALRLGMAQAMQGKYADAEASLAKVTGTRQPVAKLWSAYAKGKAAPTAPAAAG